MYWSRTIRFTKPNNNVVARYLQARGIVEDRNTGNILVVGVLRGLFDANISNPFAMMLNNTGTVLWARSYDFGVNLTNEFNAAIQIFDNNFLIGGTSNTNSAIAPNPGNFDMWLTKIDALGNIIFSNIYQQYNNTTNNYVQSKCNALVERTRFSGRSEYFMTGPALSTAGQQVSVYRVSITGAPINNWRYNNSTGLYENGYGIDAVELGLQSAGLAVFAHTIDPPANAGQPVSLLLKTYFNGATCTNYCPTNPVSVSPVSIQIVDINTEARNFILRTRLREVRRNGLTTTLCSQNTVSCGSNTLTNAATEFTTSGLQAGSVVFISPNPARHTINIHTDGLQSGRAQISITGTSGEFRIQREIVVNPSGQNVPIDVSSLAPGTYMLKITQGTNSKHGIFIKE